MRGRIVAKRRRQTIMAQQASSTTQREPSMEEILASIRRIIEDNEAPKREPDFEPLETAIGPAANDPARSEFFGKTLQPEITPEAPIVEPEEEAVLDQGAVIDEPALDMSAFSEAIEEETRRAADPQWDIAALRSLDERVVAHAPKPVVDAGDVVPPAEFAGATESKPAIISDYAGRQVAASFGELSEAFAASRRRSFDEMAEEMIRPMLQDWLDNNLPVLVERLVREEIERVARGV